MIENLFLLLAILLLLRGIAEELFFRRPLIGGTLVLFVLAAMNPQAAAPYVEPIATLVLVLIGLYIVITAPFRRSHGHRHDCDD